MKFHIGLFCLFATILSQAVFAQTLTINASGETSPSSTWSTSGSNPFIINVTGATTLNTSVIQNQLNNGNSVIVKFLIPGGFLDLTAPISKTAGTDATLTFIADKRVNIGGGVSSSAGKLNLVVWSDYNNTNTGGSCIYASINTNGGHLWVGGSSTSEGSTTWNGLTVGNGPSVGASTSNHISMDFTATNVLTGGGDVFIWAGAGYNNNDGLGLLNNPHINAGSGDITILTKKILDMGTSNSLYVTTTGKLALATDVSNPWTSAFDWSTTVANGAHTLSSTYGRPLVINNFANLSGLTIGTFDGFGSVTPSFNQQDVKLNSNITIAGPLTVYGNNIELGTTGTVANQGVYLTTTTADGDITLRANNGFKTAAASGTLRGKLMTSGGGDIFINADYDNNNSGELNVDFLTIDVTSGQLVMEATTFVWLTAAQIELPEIYANGGSLTLKNVSSSSYSIVSSWFAMFGTYSGLELGRDGSTGDVIITHCTVCDASAINSNTGVLSINGPITLYGREININKNLYASLNQADILFKATNVIIVDENKIIQSNNGDITFWSNADGLADANGDFIGFNSGVVLNSAGGSTTQTTGGGRITMAGGTSTQTISGQVYPNGYAYSNRTVLWGSVMPSGINFGKFIGSASVLNTFKAYSGGGDIFVKGQAGNSVPGIAWFRGYTGAEQILNAGAGTITVIGDNTATGHGVEFSYYTNSTIPVYPTLTSSNTSSSAISIIGETVATGQFAGYQGTASLVANGENGGILISGTTSNNDIWAAIEATNISLQAVSGPITLIGIGGSGLNVGGVWGQGSLPSSSSSITLRSDKFTFSNPTIATTGTITVEPYSSSFTSNLSFPISGMTIANTVGGLTLGKLNNNSNITISSATSIAGPITLYGNTIALNGSLTTTNSSTGDISINGSSLTGSSNLVLANNRSLTFNISSNTQFAGDVIATGLSLVKSGSGDLTLLTPTSLDFASVTINAGNFIVKGTQQLTISGTLTNNGVFTMESGATLLPGLSYTQSGTGVYNVQQAITGTNSGGIPNGRFWYVSPAVSGAYSTVFNAGGPNVVKWYDESTFQWQEITNDATLLTAGKGYYIRAAANSTLNFTGGALNNGSYNLALTRTGTSNSFRGFNLVANPYPSYLDWDNVTRTNVSTTMWYRTANTAGSSVFDTYNADGGVGTNNNQQGAVTKYIPPMQSYWVFVTPGNPTGSISFGNAQRSHYQTGVQGLRSTAQDFPMFLRLNVKQGSSVDQAILYLKQEATAAFDVYDSEKMFAPGIPQLYTQVSGKKLVINGMKNNKKQQIIPLYIDAPTTGIFTFEVEEFNNEDGLILLEDKQEGIIQDITMNPTYTFYANSGTIANRFYIRFLQPDLTITAQGPVSSWVEEAAVINEGGNILVSSNGRGKVTVMQDIDESSTQKGSVVVRDATGRMVYEGSLLSTTMTIDLEEPSGIYFVEVQFSGQVEVQKIMIY